MARWQRTLYIMVFAQLMAAVGFSIMFPFLPLYVQELGTRTGLSIEFLAGMVFSAQAVTMMVASPIWGALADRYGRKLMVERATFGGAVVLFLMGFARSAEDLVLLRAVQGMVTGTISAANALVASITPRQRTGYAMGVLQVGLWSGVAVGPLIGGIIADSLGYRATFVATSVLLTIAGMVVWLGVDEVAGSSSGGSDGNFSMLAEWRHVLSSSGVVLTYAIRFASRLGRNMMTPIMPLFIQFLLPHTARVATFTGLVVGVSSATGTVSAIYLGRLGDRLGHRWILTAGAVLAGLFYLLQSLVTTAWQLLVLQGLAGAALGGIMPALSALLAYYSPPGEEGAVYGLDNSVVAAARAVAPLAGAAIAVWFGMRGTFAAAGVIFVLTALLAARGLPERA